MIALKPYIHFVPRFVQRSKTLINYEGYIKILPRVRLRGTSPF